MHPVLLPAGSLTGGGLLGPVRHGPGAAAGPVPGSSARTTPASFFRRPPPDSTASETFPTLTYTATVHALTPRGPGRSSAGGAQPANVRALLLNRS